MRLVILLVVLAAARVFAGDPHAGHQMPAAPAASPPGYVALRVEGGAIAGQGLSVARVEPRPLTRSLRLFGVVALDETRTFHVHSKVRGTLESVSANFLGKTVKQGEALAELYSPGVYGAELELVALLKQGRPPGDPLVEAARRRLLLWDVPPLHVERVMQTQRASRTFTLYAPRAGTVLERQAVNGMFVGPELELFVVSDLSTVWVLVDVPEGDAQRLSLDVPAKVKLDGLPGALEGQLAFLSPGVDEATRTVKGRVVLPNAERVLRLGAFAEVSLEVALGTALTVPREAVLRTGRRDLVFVVMGEHVEPREVQLGASAGGLVQVMAGLTEGDMVATGAQFLLDSESRLRATSGPGGGHAGH